MIKRLLLAVSVCLLAASPAAADYETGVLAYDQGRFDEANKAFRTLAEKGHAGAEFMLGAIYFYGKGVVRDDALAAIWFHKAAIKGNPHAQLAFGSLHVRGIGVRQDLIEAYKWLTVAANSGQPALSQQALLLRGEAAALMRPDEIQEAQRRATNWEPIRAGLTGFRETRQ